MEDADHFNDAAGLKPSGDKPGAVLARGFCIFVDSVRDGYVPASRCGQGTLRVFATRPEAEREIARAMIGSLQEFIEDRKDFDDATTLKEFAVDVDILPDCKLVTEDGCTFE